MTAHGLILEFLASFSGLVDFMHIDPDKDSYRKGEEVSPVSTSIFFISRCCFSIRTQAFENFFIIDGVKKNPFQ